MENGVESIREQRQEQRHPAGLAGWLLGRLRGKPQAQPRLALLERITLAPRQTLSLVEAEGRRFLIVNAADGSPAFYALDGAVLEAVSSAAKGKRPAAKRHARLSW